MTDQSATDLTGADPHKHRRLLETAAGEFSRLGFERASVDTIAERAGVAKGTVYLYFQNKAALFHAVLQEVRRRLAALQPAEDPAHPVAALRSLIHDQLALADAAPDLFRCYVSALFGVNRDFQADARAILAWQQSVLQRPLRAAGVTHDVEERAGLLAAAVLAAGLVRGLNGDTAADTQLEENLFLQGFLKT